jgi:uncharacterized protein (DUF2062 family)
MLFVIVSPLRRSTEHKLDGYALQGLQGLETSGSDGRQQNLFPNMMEERTWCVELERKEDEGFFRRRIVRPIVELLRHGVTPEKIALSLALGVALGVFPVLGTTTALCALAAFVWRLNLPAIQIVNYFVYPLQIALILPFFRAGEKLFGAPHLPLSISQIVATVHASFWGATRLLWTTIWHAAVAWCLVAPLFVALAYVVFVPLLRGVARRGAKAKVTD